MKRHGKIAYRKRPPVRVVLSTFGSGREAKRMAQGLIRQRLAACCNVVPGLTSVFTWKGKAEEAGEALLLVKTVSRRLPQVLAYLRRHHPYELPELIVFSLEGGEASYLKWVMDSCQR